jgi:hypothetical protein
MKKVASDLVIATVVFALFIGVLLLSNYIHYGTFIF